MGAQQFWAVGKGDTPAAAFAAAIEAAKHEHGHGGYTGTIAEKGGDGFVVIAAPGMAALPADDRRARLAAARKLADELLEADDPRVDDKHGPAGCIAFAPGGHLFFGWASS